jgi:hypothetical protein
LSTRTTKKGHTVPILCQKTAFSRLSEVHIMTVVKEYAKAAELVMKKILFKEAFLLKK